jgi:hypothetical protein
MWTNSQILVVVGLVFEFVSVAVTIRKYFWNYYKRIDEMGKTNKQQRRSDKIEGIVVLCFLCIGMILQGLAVFV